MGVSNGDGDGGGVDGDGSGGNSPSRQGAGTDTSVPRISSSVAAALRNFSWISNLVFQVFISGGIYRLRGKVGGCLRGPHHMAVRPGGPRGHLVWLPCGAS